MDKKRFTDRREHRYTISETNHEDPVLIACPRCGTKAVVIPHGDDEVKASCTACAFSRVKSANGRAFYWYSDDPGDGYFGFDLWLVTTCNGNSLWAFNQKHLDFLENYVAAALRTRSPDEERGWRNSSLASRLPKWIKSAKNRDALLKSIDELKAKL